MGTGKFFVSLIALSLALHAQDLPQADRLSILDERQQNLSTFTLRAFSPSIAENKLGDSGVLYLHVFLPPSYSLSSTKRYPVVYFLAGFGEGLGDIQHKIPGLMQTFSEGGSREFILVYVLGSNRLIGSFYVNSLVTGRWEDFVVDEVPALIDGRFRTLAATESRGIAGFSMGGFGAWNLALAHPEVYCAAFIMSPGAFAPGGLEKAMRTWDGAFKTAYGAAFAPDLSRGSPWAAVPALDCSAADRAVAREWEMGFGGIPEKIRAYREGTRRVKAFHIEYGAMDSYPWIRDGSEYLVACLREAGARVSSRKIEGQSHVYTRDQIQGRFASFWDENLAFQ